MIPISLILKNFMCYKDNVPKLSFEGIHIACLCGDNGNGKSAIFDALTWVLWGQSRADSDDDLIHFGQEEMRVELEFMLGGQKYRVIRTRNKKATLLKSGQSTLDLFIFDEQMSYKSISGNTISETQKKIVNLLHMDYMTFTNSAFLRQGHSNDFSIRRPAERKEILVNILELYIYDELAKKAREKSISVNNSINTIIKLIEDMTNKLSLKDLYSNETSKLIEHKNEIEAQKNGAETTLMQIREKRALLEVKREKRSHINSRIDEINRDLTTWKNRIDISKNNLDSYHEILNRSAEIDTKYSELLSLKKQMDDYNTKLSETMNLHSRMKLVEEALNKTREGILVEYEKSRELFRINQDIANQTEFLLREQTRIKWELNTLEQQEFNLQSDHERYNDILKITANIKAVIIQLGSQLKDNVEKIRLLEEGDATCPLCGQAITELERLEINNRLSNAIEGIQQKKLVARLELNSKEEEQVNLLKRIQSTEKNIKLIRDDLNKQGAIVLNRIMQAQKAAGDISEISKKMTALEKILSTDNYELDKQQELKDLLLKLDSIKYSKDEHESTKSKLEALQKYEEIKQRLNEAVNMSVNEQKILDEAKQIFNQLEELLKGNYQQLDLLSIEMKDLEEDTQFIEIHERHLQKLLTEEKSILTQIAVNQERLRELHTIDETKQKKERELSNSQFAENVYRDLMDAFSKKGIQALLISQAFPEIEIEANRLLSKMSDNRLSLKLESQRESKSKKGEPIETLEIKISDELGTRNYEMFSGGESFRIDLALRIALSKLLVRRAGASLPVLIIDEGFGTQDNTGKERLIEAIKSIEDDFEKIFVITHLEDLKESFPVTINVIKTAEGSSITVS